MTSRKVPWAEEGAKFRGENSGSEAESSGKSPGKSAITNGSRWLVGVDGRNPWSRRCRDVARAFVADLGGKDNASAAQLALARRAAVLVVQLEQLEARMAEGDNTNATTDHYGRGASHLRRILETLGIERKQRDVTDRRSALHDLLVLEGKIVESPEDSND